MAQAEIARSLANQSTFTITRIEVGSGKLQGDYRLVTGLANKLDIPVTINGVRFVEEEEPYFCISASLTNAGLTETTYIRELGVYIETPTGNVMGIYSVLDGATDTDNLLPPPATEGLLVSGVYDTIREENICILFKDMPLELDQLVVVIAPGNTLTIISADGRYWRLGVQYPATEITESVGTTVEAHQRWQDERLQIIQQTLDSGTTNATTVEVGATRPLLWQILNYNGFYDVRQPHTAQAVKSPMRL